MNTAILDMVKWRGLLDAQVNVSIDTSLEIRKDVLAEILTWKAF